MNQTTQTYLISMAGRELYIQVPRKKFHMASQNRKEKHVTTRICVDTNLHHDQVTGRAVTASLHLVNATPSHWHTKRQATAATTTFGSELWQPG